MEISLRYGGSEADLIAVADLHTARLWVLARNTRAREFYRKGGWTPDGAVREKMILKTVTSQLRYTRQLWSGA